MGPQLGSPLNQNFLQLYILYHIFFSPQYSDVHKYSDGRMHASFYLSFTCMSHVFFPVDHFHVVLRSVGLAVQGQDGVLDKLDSSFHYLLAQLGWLLYTSSTHIYMSTFPIIA